MRARLVIEKETALRIGANSNGCPGALGDKLRCRSSYRGKQPIEATFASDELYAPCALFENQFVMAFGDSKDLVDGLNALPGDLLSSMHGRKGLAKRCREPPGLKEQRLCRLGIRLGKGEELGATFGRDDTSGLQQRNELLPSQFCVGRSSIYEVEAKTAAK